MLPSIEQPYTTLDEAANSLTELQQIFRANADRRAVFVTCYLVMTRDMRNKTAQGFFADNAWVTRYALAFANYYRQAILDWSTDNISQVPECWQIAFRAAEADTTLILQDLLLGINAHIDHDLALALDRVGIQPESLRHEDHLKVNEVLVAATVPIEQAIGRYYAPGLNLLGRTLGPLAVIAANLNIDLARNHAWNMAAQLVAAKADAKRASLTTELDKQASLIANLVIGPTHEMAFLVPALKRLEADHSWLQVLEGLE